MILLKQVQLHNFLSHEDTTIDFESNEKVLLDGASGAGKSSIFEAIIWALYGQGRADNRALVRKGAKSAEVTLSLSREDETVIVTRRVTAGGAGKHTLEVSVQQADGTRTALPLSGVRETQAWIDKELIGASYLLFVNSVAYVQGNTESFVSQTAPKRKELLLEIVKAEDYTKSYEKARQTLVNLSNEENHILGQISELEASLGLIRARIAQKPQCLKDVSLYSEKHTLAVAKKTALEDKRAFLLARKATIETLKESLALEQRDANQLRSDIERRKKAVEGFGDVDTARKQQEIADALKKNSAIAEKMAQKPVVHDRNAEIDRLKKQVQDLKSKPVCPSGDKCPYSGNHAGHIEEMQAKITEMDKLMVSEAVALAEWTMDVNAIGDRIDVGKLQEEYQKALEVDSYIKEIPQMESRLEGFKARAATIEEKLRDTNIDQSIFDTFDTDLARLRAEEVEASTMLTRAKVLLEMIEKDEKNLVELTERVENLGKTTLKDIRERARKVGLVKDAFGSKGVETIVIDYLLPRLEDKINDVLSKLSDFRVRLDTQRKSADGDSVIEGLFITILNEMNEEMPFESYSGGEKLKISVAISEALATLQKVGFRMLDETFIGLDENSTESFAQVLDGLQSSFGQVLCISHLLQIKELLDKRIEIIKTNNVSYVK